MDTKRRILFADDDRYEMLGLVERTESAGYKVSFATSVEEAKQAIANDPPDLAILDVMMRPDPQDGDFESRGGFTTGLVLARWIIKNYPQVRFLGLSVATQSEIVSYFNQYGCGFVAKPVSPNQLLRHIERALDVATPHKYFRIFIVHGHDKRSTLELKNFLQNNIGLPEPVILHEQPSLGRTIFEKLEAEADDIDIVFVLLTPDDEMAQSNISNEAKRRARQNVILEMGYFLGMLRRRSGRVVLLHKGPLDLPSDISGLVYIDISCGVEGAGEVIKREILGLARSGR